MVVSPPSSWLLSSRDIVKLVLAVLKSRLGYFYIRLWGCNLSAGFSSVAHWGNEKNANTL